MTTSRWILFVCTILVGFGLADTLGGEPLIGESEAFYTLAPENKAARGLAFDNVSPEAPRLFVLDASNKIFVYKVGRDLKLTETYDLPTDGRSELKGVRGLAFSQDGDRPILYFLNYDRSGGITSQLWRCDFEREEFTTINLAWYTYCIGEREVLDLVHDNGKLLICFDASGYNNNDLRVQRGIIELKWNQGYDDKLEFVKHMPDSGQYVCRGITCMNLDGVRYLFATAGSDSIYSAQAETGRGLFYFDAPASADEDRPLWGLTFGDDSLWVMEGITGPDRVHRVNVTKNLDEPYIGPKMLRRIKMTIHTRPEKEGYRHPGEVYHYYSRPYASDVIPNQGNFPETEIIEDTSNAPNATAKRFTYDPAGDKSSRQHMAMVEYADAPAREYSSRYGIDMWMGSYRTYVYPHRVNRDLSALAGTNYLEDDPNLFNLTDTEAYGSFHERVKAHMLQKYGVLPDMKNPYWVVRNAVEYIQDHYYYPSRPHRKPATVDYDNHHYDANPGNLKIDLSSRPYDKTQITACSGTSVMLAGAMRFLGFEARWLGTGNERNRSQWDRNDNRLIDEGEAAIVSSGHRYTQVWLGSHYGWICFDATPTKPDDMDYDPVPPLKSQWRYMNRSAQGHRNTTRIVFNVGSGLFLPLYRDFEYDERLAIDNNCGGDQRYNAQGRFEKPALWKGAGHRIYAANVCFIEDIKLLESKGKTDVTWKLKGLWDKDPGATVSVYLQQVSGTSGRDVATLAKGIDATARNATVDLTGYEGKDYRIMIRKDGDPETGGMTETFSLD